MAKQVSGVTLNTPSTDPNVDEGQGFTMGATVAWSGGGTPEDAYINWRYSTTSGGPYNDIPTSGGVLTISGGSNPTGPYSTESQEEQVTITANTAGTYYLHVYAHDLGEASTAEDGNQIVTVNSTSTNVNLTGETATATEGTLATTVDLTLTGETATATEGTLATTVDLTLTGETATATDGTLTPSTPSTTTPYPVDYILLRNPELYSPNTKPRGPVKIDWTHPMTVGLQAAFIFNQWNGILTNRTRDITGHGHDIIWVTVPTIGPYANDTYGGFGYGIKSTGASNHYGYIAAGNIPAAGEDVYAMAWGGIGELAGTGIFTIYGPSGGTTDLQMWHGSAGYQFQPYNCADSPNETVMYDGTGPAVLDRRICVAYWNDTANSQQGVYSMRDDILKTQTDTLTSDPLPQASRKLLFLTDADALGTDGDGSLGNWHQGVVEYWYCWNRKLTETEGHSINKDPYQFFIPV